MLCPNFWYPEFVLERGLGSDNSLVYIYIEKNKRKDLTAIYLTFGKPLEGGSFLALKRTQVIKVSIIFQAADVAFGKSGLLDQGVVGDFDFVTEAFCQAFPDGGSSVFGSAFGYCRDDPVSFVKGETDLLQAFVVSLSFSDLEDYFVLTLARTLDHGVSKSFHVLGAEERIVFLDFLALEVLRFRRMMQNYQGSVSLVLNLLEQIPYRQESFLFGKTVRSETVETVDEYYFRFELQ